jgi:hypothetical protein
VRACRRLTTAKTADHTVDRALRDRTVVREHRHPARTGDGGHVSKEPSLDPPKVGAAGMLMSAPSRHSMPHQRSPCAQQERRHVSGDAIQPWIQYLRPWSQARYWVKTHPLERGRAGVEGADGLTRRPIRVG